MTVKRVWWVIYTEDGRFAANARGPVSAFFKGLWLGWKSYFVLDPQRVVIEKWTTWSDS